MNLFEQFLEVIYEKNCSRRFSSHPRLRFCSSSLAQEEIDPRLRTADTNNAVIHGKVTLPSGFLIESYAKITLRNHQSILQTLHTDKSGEFQILNLSEGVYFVQAETLDGVFEPVYEEDRAWSWIKSECEPGDARKKGAAH